MKVSQTKMTSTTTQNDGGISYEKLRQQRIKENMERMLKLGISDLSKKLKSKPPSPLPKKSIKKKNKSEVETTEPPRRSSRLEKLTPVIYPVDFFKMKRKKTSVSYGDSRPKAPKGRKNQMEEEEEEDDDDEEEDDESEDEDGNYRTKASINSDLCGRRSTRLQKVSRVNYAEVTPKKTNIVKDGEIEEEDVLVEEEEDTEEEDVLVEEEEKPEMDTEEDEKSEMDTEEDEKSEMDTEEDEKSAKQRVSVNRSIVFDNVEQSLHPFESVNSSAGGRDPDVGEVISPKQT